MIHLFADTATATTAQSRIADSVRSSAEVPRLTMFARRNSSVIDYMGFTNDRVSKPAETAMALEIMTNANWVCRAIRPHQFIREPSGIR